MQIITRIIVTNAPTTVVISEFTILCQSYPMVLGFIKVSFKPNTNLGLNPSTFSSGCIIICPEYVKEQSFDIKNTDRPLVDFTNCPFLHLISNTAATFATTNRPITFFTCCWMLKIFSSHFSNSFNLGAALRYKSQLFSHLSFPA